MPSVTHHHHTLHSTVPHKVTFDELTTDIEAWLTQPALGFNSMEQAINCELAEIGADREGDFDLEAEQEKRYHAWLDVVNN